MGQSALDPPQISHQMDVQKDVSKRPKTLKYKQQANANPTIGR
jgi:hypothetical protein